MSRCRQTEALLDATFAGTGFTRAEADHAAGCSECARALAQARRFDAELSRAGLELAPEPMPAAAELTRVATPTRRGGWIMTWRQSLIGGAVTAVLLVGVIFGGGQWLGSMFEGRVIFAPVGAGRDSEAVERAERAQAERAAAQRAAAEAARRQAANVLEVANLDAWVAAAVAPGMTRNDLELVRADHCGDLYTVVFVERQSASQEYRWLAGVSGHADSAQGGLADSIDASGVAAARATTDDACIRLIDTVPTVEIMDAVHGAAGVPANVSLLGTTLLEPGLSVTVVEGRNQSGVHQRWIGSLGLADGHWTTSPTNWVGTNVPANDGFTRYDGRHLPVLADRSIVVGELPAGATTVELIVDGTVYRYEADPGARGLIVAAPAVDVTTFRVLGPDGFVMVEGSIER